MSDVLREYLIELGFKVDNRSWSKFNQAVEKSETGVALLAGTASAAALAVTAATIKMAANLDSLYWASQRVGSTVQNIKAYSFAVGQMGGSSAEALGSLENLAKFLAVNPGGEGFLARLGIRTRGRNNELRDTVDLMGDLAKAFREMPRYRAIQYAERLGIDYRTMLAMINGTGAYQNKYNGFAKMFGVDLQKASKDSKDFTNNIRELRAVVELLFAATMSPGMAKFMDWTRDPATQTGMRDGVKNTKDLADAVGGLASAIGPLLMAAAKIGPVIVGGLTAGINAMAALYRMAQAVTRGDWSGAKAEARNYFASLGSAPVVHGASTAAGNIVGAAVDASLSGGRGSVGTTGVVKTLMGMGWSADQARGMAANLWFESSFNPNAVGDGGRSIGIGQWNGSRRRALEAFAKARGKPVNDLGTQLAFMDWELRHGGEQGAGRSLMGARSSRQAAEIVSRQYERPMNADFDAARRGALAETYGRARLGEGASNRSVVLNQKTEINLNGHGVANPQDAARLIAASQPRANGDAVRNLAAAAQ